MTISIPPGRTISLQSKSGGGFESVGVPAVAAFTPMVAEDHAGETPGQTDLTWTEAQFSDVVAKSGTTSVRLKTLPSTGLECGGANEFGKRRALPALVPLGNTVWQRIYFYLPSAFSMGYTYGQSDCTEANACGQDCDGTRFGLKWLVFSPNIVTNGVRMYVNPAMTRRQITQPNPTSFSGLRVIAEASPVLDVDNNTPVFPRDVWFCVEMAAKASNTGDGFVRVWQDGVLFDEKVNIDTVPSVSTGIDEWGIGDYWNGIPWTDGAPGRDTFYIDEIIVASDLDGFGAPTATDAAGNLMIGPTTLVGDL